MPGRFNGTKNKFQFYTLSVWNILFFFFLLNTPKFLNLTTAPAFSSQNHIAVTSFSVSLSLHLDFFQLILWPPFTPSRQSLLWWSALDPASFSFNVSSQSSSHPCLWSSIDSFDVLYLTLSGESRGRA